MIRRHRLPSGWLSLMTMAGLLSACASPVARQDPAAALADREQTHQTRVTAVREALRRVQAGEMDPGAFRESLKSVAWRRSESSDLRLAAIEALAEHDPDDTRAMLSLMLPTENAWPVLDRVCAMAGERGWTGLTPALVRSWSRPVDSPPDDQRPEHAALAALHPGRPVEDVVFDVFAEPAGQNDLFGDQRRADAWALLMRIDEGGEVTRRRIAEMPADQAPGDPVLADLMAAAEDFGLAPTTAEELQWLRTLRRPQHADLWSEALEAAQRIPAEARASVRLRHLPALAWAADHRPRWLVATRTELLSQARAELSGARTHRRIEGYADLMAAPRETVDASADAMSWGDALLLRISIEAVQAPALAGFLFDHADRDRGDTSTELGGAIVDPKWSDADASARVAGEEFVAVAYDPRPGQRQGDNRFVASPELLEQAAPALFHYHFHAQRYDNADYAGPGAADLEYTERFGRACIVLTFITRDILGADYYQPGGVRVDLGEIPRPD